MVGPFASGVKPVSQVMSQVIMPVVASKGYQWATLHGGTARAAGAVDE